MHLVTSELPFSANKMAYVDYIWVYVALFCHRSVKKDEKYTSIASMAKAGAFRGFAIFQ